MNVQHIWIVALWVSTIARLLIALIGLAAIGYAMYRFGPRYRRQMAYIAIWSVVAIALVVLFNVLNFK